MMDDHHLFWTKFWAGGSVCLSILAFLSWGLRCPYYFGLVAVFFEGYFLVHKQVVTGQNFNYPQVFLVGSVASLFFMP